MPDMQGTGRVRRDEFNLHRPPSAGETAAVPRSAVENPGDFRVVGVLRQKEIDESRACDLDLGHGRARRQQAHQGFGQLAWILARGLG